jgi:2-dehydropantoate 2-reductase
MQNGLGIEEDLAAKFGEQRLMGAIAFTCCNRVAAGAVKHIREGFIRIGELNRPPAQQTQDIAAMFNASQVQCTILPNLRRGRWEKLVWNIPFNGLGALREQTTEELLITDRDFVAGLMNEVIQIAHAEGFDFPEDLPERLIRMTAPMGRYKTSMQIDRELGLPLEIDAIIGRPLQVAQQRKVPSPRLQKLYEGLSQIPLARA